MGPGTVTAKESDNGYYVSLEDGSVRHIHANMIRKFNPRVASIGVVFEDEEEFGDIGFEPEVNPGDIVQASPSGDRFDAVNLEHLRTSASSIKHELCIVLKTQPNLPLLG